MYDYNFTFHYVYIYIYHIRCCFIIILNFTFHYVYIYMQLGLCSTFSHNLFTFHYVYIYIDFVWTGHRLFIIFTFHYVYIYIRAAKLIDVKKTPLHSTMFIFICNTVTSAYTSIIPLHSTMFIFIYLSNRSGMTFTGVFTFHYVYIYMEFRNIRYNRFLLYIPLCLYLYAILNRFCKGLY